MVKLTRSQATLICLLAAILSSVGLAPTAASAMVITAVATGSGMGTNNSAASAAALEDAESKMSCLIGSIQEGGVGLEHYSTFPADSDGNTVLCVLNLNYSCVS